MFSVILEVEVAKLIRLSLAAMATVWLPCPPICHSPGSPLFRARMVKVISSSTSATSSSLMRRRISGIGPPLGIYSAMAFEPTEASTTPLVPRVESQFGAGSAVVPVREVSRWKTSLPSAVPLVSRIKQMPPPGMMSLFALPPFVREKGIVISLPSSTASVRASAKPNTGAESLSRMVNVYSFLSGSIRRPRALEKPAPSSNIKV